MDWLSDIWASLTAGRVLIGVGVFLLSLGLSFAAIAIVMVKIPANYFSSHYVQDFLPGSPWIVRWGAVVAKNLLGIFLVGLGLFSNAYAFSLLGRFVSWMGELKSYRINRQSNNRAVWTEEYGGFCGWVPPAKVLHARFVA